MAPSTSSPARTPTSKCTPPRSGRTVAMKCIFVKNVGPDGVTICVLYHSGDDCSADQSSRSSRHHGLFSFHSSSDAQTDFVIDVPPGVNLELANISGSVQASGTSGTVDARVVNGEINVASHEGA